jgi:hypothetical protein
MHPDGAYAAFLQKHESQLLCRALVQVSILAHHQNSVDRIRTQIRGQVVVEVPKFVSRLLACVKNHAIGLTFIDAYDAFASIIAYICSLHPENIAAPLRITEMKVVMSTMDILETITERFPTLRGLKTVIWGFLAAREAVSTGGDSFQATNALPSSQRSSEILSAEFRKSDVPIPGSLRQLMESSLHPGNQL